MSLEKAKEVLDWHGMDMPHRMMRICYELRPVEGTPYLEYFMRLCALDLMQNRPAPWDADEWLRGFGPVLRTGKEHPRWDAFTAIVHGYRADEWGFESPSFIMRIYQHATSSGCAKHAETVSYYHMRAWTDMSGDAALQRRTRTLAYCRQLDIWRALFYQPNSISNEDGLRLPWD